MAVGSTETGAEDTAEDTAVSLEDTDEDTEDTAEDTAVSLEDTGEDTAVSTFSQFQSISDDWSLAEIGASSSPPIIEQTTSKCIQRKNKLTFFVHKTYAIVRTI